MLDDMLRSLAMITSYAVSYDIDDSVMYAVMYAY